VAVIDTGIAKVGDLAGRVRNGIDLTDEGDPYLDSFGHGTFVAGVMAGDGHASNGATRGIAPRVDLVPVKIAGRSGATDVSHVLAAIQWVVSFRDKYGIRVVNLSLGTDSKQPYMRSPLDYAVERAWDAGIVVVASASNSGPEPGTVAKPGDDPLVVTVGAIDDQTTVTRDDDVMAGFSGVGPTAADDLVKPDLVAPGRSVSRFARPRVSGGRRQPRFPGGVGLLQGLRDVVLGRDRLRCGRPPAQQGARAGAGPGQAAAHPRRPRRARSDSSTWTAPAPSTPTAAATATTLTAANQGVPPVARPGRAAPRPGQPRGRGRGRDGAGTRQRRADRPEEGLEWRRIPRVVLERQPLVQQPVGGAAAGTRPAGTATDFAGSRWYSTRWYGSRWYATAWE